MSAEIYRRAFLGAPSATFSRPGSPDTATARVRPQGGERDTLAGATEQRALRLIAIAADFSAPYGAPQDGDRVEYNGATFAIERVDADSRSIGGVTLAYVVDCMG